MRMVAPRRKQGGYIFVPMGFGQVPPFLLDAADFDGSAEHTARGAGLNGAVDSKLYTFACWINPDTLVGDRLFNGVDTLGGGSSTGIIVDYGVTVGSEFTIRGRNAAGTVILQATADVPPPIGAWTCVLFSCDLTDTNKRHFYYGDATAVPTWTTYTNDTLDFTCADWIVGSAGSAGSEFDGGVAQLYFKIGQYIDFSSLSNRRKFIRANGKPENLGLDGSRPGLGVPECYFHLDNGEAAANFAINRGSGGNFAVTGALSTAATSPSD